MSYHLHVKDVMQRCVEVHPKRFGTSTQHQWLMGLSLSLSLSLCVHDLQEISYHLHVQDSLQKSVLKYVARHLVLQ